MIDRLFFAALTFTLLVAGTLAIGAAMIGADQRTSVSKAASAPVRIVQLERVVVVAKRLAPAMQIARSDADERVARVTR
jgi:hypothetical protein